MANQNTTKPVLANTKPAAPVSPAPTPAPTPAVAQGEADEETGEEDTTGARAPHPVSITIQMSDGTPRHLILGPMGPMSTGSLGCTYNGKIEVAVGVGMQVGINMTVNNSNPAKDLPSGPKAQAHPGRAAKLWARYGFSKPMTKQAK